MLSTKLLEPIHAKMFPIPGFITILCLKSRALVDLSGMFLMLEVCQGLEGYDWMDYFGFLLYKIWLI